MSTTIEIYTRVECRYCDKAKDLLEQKGVSFHEISLDKHPERTAEMEKRSHGRRSVPQIFIGHFHVGGCDDLYQLDEEGKLDELLAGYSQ